MLNTNSCFPFPNVFLNLSQLNNPNLIRTCYLSAYPTHPRIYSPQTQVLTMMGQSHHRPFYFRLSRSNRYNSCGYLSEPSSESCLISGHDRYNSCGYLSLPSSEPAQQTQAWQCKSAAANEEDLPGSGDTLSIILTRNCHNLTRNCFNLTRNCHNLTRNFHNLTGNFNPKGHGDHRDNFGCPVRPHQQQGVLYES